METLLELIYDPTISLNNIFHALDKRLGQNDAKAIVGAGLIQMHEHLKINLGDLIAYITNNKKAAKQLNHDENQHETKDCNKNQATSEQTRKFVLENTDLCCKIASHFNSMEINQNIIFVNKHFYNVCNNPQTYESHKFSKNVFQIINHCHRISIQKISFHDTVIVVMFVLQCRITKMKHFIHHKTWMHLKNLLKCNVYI